MLKRSVSPIGGHLKNADSVKIRVIYLPFLLIAVCCVTGYTVLNWLLIIETGFTGLNEEAVNFWLPYAVPWIPILLWLSPRLKALRQSDGGGDRRFSFSMTAALAVTAPTIVSQYYLEIQSVVSAVI